MLLFLFSEIIVKKVQVSKLVLTHNIPTSRKRKEIASFSGNAWIHSTFDLFI